MLSVLRDDCVMWRLQTAVQLAYNGGQKIVDALVHNFHTAGLNNLRFALGIISLSIQDGLRTIVLFHNIIHSVLDGHVFANQDFSEELFVDNYAKWS